MQQSKRFGGRLQSFETEVRVLSYFLSRDLDYLTTSDVAIIRYFCEDALLHRDCPTCIESLVNSQYRFCGWCTTDNTCRFINDLSKCEKQGRVRHTPEKIIFHSPYLHPSLCPIKQHHERGALGCAANQHCHSCLEDNDCFWCESTTNDSLAPQPNEKHFLGMTPGLRRSASKTIAVPAMPSLLPLESSHMNYTRVAWMHYSHVSLDEEGRRQLLDRLVTSDEGLTALKKIATIERVRPGGYCIESTMSFVLCTRGVVSDNHSNCPATQRYSVTPTVNPIPPWDRQLLSILCIPFGLLAVMILLMQCFVLIRNRRHMKNWQEHMAEATEYQKAKKGLLRRSSSTELSSYNNAQMKVAPKRPPEDPSEGGTKAVDYSKGGRVRFQQ